MNLRFWILLFLLILSFPLVAQLNQIPDSLPVSIDTTTLNDISTQTIDIITPNQGFSFNSLWRGALGMFVLILISYLFSANRNGINWRTVGIGVGGQLILAIGILKVPFIQTIFRAAGQFFVNILDYTLAGSEFLLGNLLNVDNPNIGYVFAFQILPLSLIHI